MRHLKKGRKLHRKKDPRQALIKGLVANLILQGRIKTTMAKAKEARQKAEKLITKAKKQNVSALRDLKRYLPERAVNKLYYEIASLFKERPGGYTRIIKTGENRVKDGTALVILELVKEKIGSPNKK